MCATRLCHDIPASAGYLACMWSMTAPSANGVTPACTTLCARSLQAAGCPMHITLRMCSSMQSCMHMSGGLHTYYCTHVLRYQPRLWLQVRRGWQRLRRARPALGSVLVHPRAAPAAAQWVVSPVPRHVHLRSLHGPARHVCLPAAPAIWPCSAPARLHGRRGCPPAR